MPSNEQSVNVFSAPPEKKDGKKETVKSYKIILIVLLILSVIGGVGGYFLYRQSTLQALRESEDTFATVPDKLQIAPVSGNWNQTNKFEVKNISSSTITVTWFLDCWEEPVCQDTVGKNLLAPGESFQQGLGPVCAKWQLDLTTIEVDPEWSSPNDIPDNFQWEWGGVVEKPTNCSGTNTPAPTPTATATTYTPPDYPACPAGTQRFTATRDLLNQAGSNTFTHTLNTSSAGLISKITGVKKEGHPEELCLAGPNNDNGKYPCDQGQLNEGFKIYLNNKLIATVNDEGAGKDDQWFGFESSPTSNNLLASGNNSIKFEHIGGTGPGSVEYKASFCYSLGSATPNPTPTQAPIATPRATPPVGGPDNTPAPTSTPAPTTQVTSSPAATTSPTQTPVATPAQTSTPDNTPAPSTTVIAQATASPTNPPTEVANSTNATQNGTKTELKTVAGTEKLPAAGVEDTAKLLLGLGVGSIVISGFFYKKKKKWQ